VKTLEPLANDSTLGDLARHLSAFPVGTRITISVGGIAGPRDGFTVKIATTYGTLPPRESIETTRAGLTIAGAIDRAMVDHAARVIESVDELDEIKYTAPTLPPCPGCESCEPGRYAPLPPRDEETTDA